MKKKVFLIGFAMIILAIILLPQDIEIQDDPIVVWKAGTIHWCWLLIMGIVSLIIIGIMSIFYHLRNEQVKGLENCINYERTLLEKKDKALDKCKEIDYMRSQIADIEYKETVILEYEEQVKIKNKALKKAERCLKMIQEQQYNDSKNKFVRITAENVWEHLEDFPPRKNGILQRDEKGKFIRTEFDKLQSLFVENCKDTILDEIGSEYCIDYFKLEE